jgi:hypothetical protein
MAMAPSERACLHVLLSSSPQAACTSQYCHRGGFFRSGIPELLSRSWLPDRVEPQNVAMARSKDTTLNESCFLMFASRHRVSLAGSECLRSVLPLDSSRGFTGAAVAQLTTSGDPSADRVDPDDPQEGQNGDSGQGVG